MRIVAAMTVAVSLLAMLAMRAVAAVPKDLVGATLLADVDSVKPGKPFKLGVLLKIKPGWHVYWKNPGESGMPTTITWKLPDGFATGELQFPFPTRFDQPGDIVGFGYHDEVLLTATITPPIDLAQDKPLNITAEVAWLVCEKVCIPGKEEVTLLLPVAQAAPADNLKWFIKWSDQLPKPAKDFGRDNDRIWLKLPTASPSDVQWFPIPPEGCGIEKLHPEAMEGREISVGQII